MKVDPFKPADPRSNDISPVSETRKRTHEAIKSRYDILHDKIMEMKSQGKATDEIAKELNLPESTVRAIIERGTHAKHDQ